jgi:hypothetical protein
MGNDRIELRWNDHGTNAFNTFKQLWGDQDFTDVTLATADDRQIQAHKAIISSCSPFFRNILVKNPHSNPLIYLKGVSYDHLESALNFIYLGQCHVRDDDISAFLATGADLGITGLMGGTEEDTEGRQEVRPKKASLPKPEYYQVDLNTEVPPTNYLSNRAEYGITEDWTERKETKRVLVPSVRQADGRFRCDMCDKDYGHQKSLTTHKQTQHEGVRYGCDQCDHMFTTQGNLTQHKQAQHEGVRCDQCDYNATYIGDLAKHKRRMHHNEPFSIV